MTTYHSLQKLSGDHVRLPITEHMYNDLMHHLRVHLSETGCDNTLRHAEAWAQGLGVTWARHMGVTWVRLRSALHSAGGYCDCEVLMNVVDASDYDDRDDDYDYYD
jgi:Protein of unknown function (DUF2695)